MAILTVAEYDHAEEEAICLLPNKVVEAFQPFAFAKTGYPFRISRDSALLKYVDVLHELRFETIFSNMLGGGLTTKEFDLLKRLTTLVCNFSEIQFGQKSLAISALLRQFCTLRHIQYLCGNEHPSIFEFGPGSGYLGALLMLEGYPYAATDVAQAFYLYQNRLWDYITGKMNVNFSEWGSQTGQKELKNLLPGDVTHIPWWEFVKFNQVTLPTFGIVICNSALCEMSRFSLKFSLIISKMLLRMEAMNSQLPIKAFVVEGWGAEWTNSIGSVGNTFNSLGYYQAFADHLITVFLPEKNDEQSTIIQQSIINGRQAFEPLKTVGIDEVNQFYTELIGSKDHLNADEKFIKFIGEIV
ncbi:hypothetical protein [Microcoleus sp. B7-D4]|uniref:hypothetical protein n=1 Tax=Microcoleus sp. B7-D4 TaxID=2818696 RepID=UPI002FD41CF2